MKNAAVQVLCLLATLIAACQGFAQAPDYDFDWATITDINNPAYGGGPSGQLAGRGSVGYEYRISKLELTSNQFLEFVNTFWDSVQMPMQTWFIGSSGIQADLQGPYALKPNLPKAGMVPVIGLSWRNAAMYCNWLHNGKQSTLESIQSGAYDVSTFGTNPDGTFTDQLTRSPDAKFWIPSLDEWMKAAHYDPNRYGEGKGGWWEYPNVEDSAPIPGPPGIGQTSAGNYDWGFDPSYIPLGSYPNVHSPWGLWDLSGGASEWTEETEPGPLHWTRGLDGSFAGATGFSPLVDLAYKINYLPPDAPGWAGLRVASQVPCPSTMLVFSWLVHAHFARGKGGRRRC